MSLLSRFQTSVKEQALFAPGDKLLIAVSGGVDSIVLCELCKQAGYDFTVAHCNFQLRGEESERDEQFVRDIAKKYGVEVLVKKFDTQDYATQKKISIQEAARNLRYEWFYQLLTPDSELQTPDYLLTAHHADDNAETVLMNFTRGTGLHGLTGIPVSTDRIRRPLLIFSKDELLAFAKENKLAFVEDSSNQSSKYTRNLFRNEIIPAISKVYPQVKENLIDNIGRFKEIEKLYKLAVGRITKKLCVQRNNEVHIPVRQLISFQNRTLIYEIISGYGFSEKQVDEVLKLAESESGRFIQSPDDSFRLIRHRHWFIISPVKSEESENIIIEQTDQKVSFSLGNLQLETTPSIKEPASSNEVASLDASHIQFPLLLRKWKQGDYFYPLGMRKKKKLARFFIDKKMSKTDKEKVWVIEMNKKIIWVVGHRIDDRFKITDQSKSILKIALHV